MTVQHGLAGFGGKPAYLLKEASPWRFRNHTSQFPTAASHGYFLEYP